MNLEVVRDLIYKEDRRTLVDMYRSFDRARMKGSPVDKVLMEAMDSYLLEHYPSWYLSGCYMEGSTPYYDDFPKCYEELPQTSLDFVQFLRDHCGSYLEMVTYVPRGAGILGYLSLGFCDFHLPKELCESFCFRFDTRGKSVIWGLRTRNVDEGLSSFEFPFDPVRSQAWITNINTDRKEVVMILRGIAEVLGKPDFFESSIVDDMVELRGVK